MKSDHWRACVSPLRQVPGIDRLIAVERHLDHLPAHQLDQRLIGIPALKDRNQRVRAGSHQEHLLRGKRLAAAALRHQQAIRIGKIRVEHREGNELPVRRLEENQRAPPRPGPRHLHRNKIGSIGRKHVLLPLVRLRHAWQASR